MVFKNKLKVQEVSYLIEREILSIMLKQLLEGVINQKEALIEANANITFIYLPHHINGLVFNHKGINNIYINKSLSYYKRKKTLLHELAHIELNQLCQSNKNLFAFYIDKYENEANEYIKELLERK